MCDNCWFYTLSAIPQTLGAIIALVAIFVIFKLDHTEDRTKKEHGEITRWLPHLFPELEISEITKMNDSAVLQRLQDGLRKLNRTEPLLGLKNDRDLEHLYEEVFRSYTARPTPMGERIYGYLVEKERIYNSVITVRKNALSRLFKCLLLITFPIAGSMILLPLRERISSPWDIYAVLLIVVLAVIAIFYTVFIVWKIAQPQLR